MADYSSSLQVVKEMRHNAGADLRCTPGMRLYSVKNLRRMMRNCCGVLRANLELNCSGSVSGAGCCRLSISSCLCLRLRLRVGHD